MVFDPTQVADADRKQLDIASGKRPSSPLTNQVVQMVIPPTCGVFSDLQPASVDDDFTGTNGDAPKKNLWSDVLHDDQDGGDSSGTVSIQSNALQFSISSAQTFPYIYTRFAISGDFDVQVDFSGVSLTTANQLVGLVANQSPETEVFGTSYLMSAARADDSLTDDYVSNYQGDTAVWAGNPDTSGKFRITRSGTTWTSYYWNGSSWTQIKQKTSGSTADVHFILFVRTWGNNSTITPSFDNFTVNSGTIVWPDSPKQFAILDKDLAQCPVEIDLWEKGPEPVSHWTTDITTLTAAEASDDFTGTDGDAPDTHKWVRYEDNGEKPA